MTELIVFSSPLVSAQGKEAEKIRERGEAEKREERERIDALKRIPDYGLAVWSYLNNNNNNNNNTLTSKAP